MSLRKKRRRRRRPERSVELVSAELDVLFSPSRKHVHERKEWVAVAKMDDREAGAGPIDLESGVVRLRTGAIEPADTEPTLSKATPERVVVDETP